MLITRSLTIIFIILLTLLISGCAEIYFSRSFIDEMEYTNGDFFTAGQDFPIVAGDQINPLRKQREIKKRTPQYRRERQRQNRGDALVAELNEKEGQLSDVEYRKYRQLFDKSIGGTSERIYYLSLDRMERERYHQLLSSQLARQKEHAYDHLADQGITRSPASHQTSGPEEDITVGMNKQEVVLRVGPPAKIETAYNNSLGRATGHGERWTYYAQGRTVKHIYFENGEVHGWKLE